MKSLTDYRKVQLLIGKLRRNKAFQISSRFENKKYLDIGCGGNIHDNFINMDYHWTKEIDVCWDITKGKLPFPDNRFEGIFTEHCLEHIPYEKCIDNLNAFYRILKPGGVLRIVVPDGELYLDIYQRRKAGETIRMPYEEGYISPMQRINGIFRNHGHLFIYDFETFKILLENCGFKNITKRSFQSGKNPDLLIDTQARSIESLYVEAEK